MSLVTVNWNPSREQLRGFGTISLAAFGLLGALIYFKHKFLWIGMDAPTARTVGVALGALAGACLILGRVAPVALRPLYVGLTALSLPIGFVLSHVMMAVIFYGILTPVGLVFRLIGRDALQRRLDRHATSYWMRREPTSDPRRYYRQF